MRYGKPSVFTGVVLVAALPLVNGHGGFLSDCNPRIALCALSDAPYLPDEPAPAHAPQLIIAPPVAGSTVALSSSALLYRFKT